MRIHIWISLIALLTTVSNYPQTQLLKPGNAVQYWYDTDPIKLWITTNSENINGKEYFKRKMLDYPFFSSNSNKISYDRIEGDSLYYILSSNNIDSLAFNFNWGHGTIIKVDTVGNSVYYERIDSIKIETTYLPNDTVYYVGLFGINLTTGDTLQRLPQIKRVYKKFGQYDMGLWGYMEGVKIDGIRYGTVYPFPEEISFSSDSIYIPNLWDTASVYIVNNSDYEVRIDSIISVGAFYGYRGCFTQQPFDLCFYLIQYLPSACYGTDSLGIIIPPHDSIKISFDDVDLCPICTSRIQDYFKDTLRFVFTFFYDQSYHYNFSKSIQISGQGHPSEINESETISNNYKLYQNYPNPFNPSTTIQYSLPSKDFVSIKVYDVLGNEIATLVNEEKEAGFYEVYFNASQIVSGVYFCQLKTRIFNKFMKMVLLR